MTPPGGGFTPPPLGGGSEYWARPLGYNIMTLDYVLERTWKEITKNMWKKGKVAQIRHFLGGVLQTVLEKVEKIKI